MYISTRRRNRRFWYMIGEVLHLFRIHAATTIALFPVLGALTAAPQTSVWELLALFGVGLSFYIFGTTLNDIVDLPVDRLIPPQSPQADRPLVKGTISTKTALFLALLHLILSFLFLLTISSAVHSTYIVLLLACALACVYDLFGKHFPISPILGDVCLGSSLALLCMLGSLATVGRFDSLVIVVACYFLIQCMVLNCVAGGLKDIDHDQLAGATTTAYWLGARLHGDRCIEIPYRLRAYAIGLEALLFAIVSVPLIGNWLAYTKIQVGVTIGVLVILAAIAFIQLAQALWERDFQKLPARLFGHSIPTFCAVPALLFFHIGGWRTVAFLLFLFGWAGFWRVANPKLRSLQ